jgi:hypothetical protein
VDGRPAQGNPKDVKKGGGKVIYPKDAHVSAYRLMGKRHVKEAVRRLLKSAQDEKDETNTYRLLKQYETMAFFDIGKILDIEGGFKVKTLSALGDLQCCIQGIKTKYAGENRYTEIELVDRRSAMADYGKYLRLLRPEGMLEEDIPVVEMPTKSLSYNDEAEEFTRRDAREHEKDTMESAAEAGAGAFVPGV